MTWLFDVNVLIAIADGRHIFHAPIHRWLARHEGDGWASCPITENGFTRIVSQQEQFRRIARVPADAITALKAMQAGTELPHVFWNDEISLTDGAVIDAAQIGGHGQITDVYLAALAFRNKGRLVTFDSRIPWQAVVGATAQLVEVPRV